MVNRQPPKQRIPKIFPKIWCFILFFGLKILAPTCFFFGWGWATNTIGSHFRDVYKGVALSMRWLHLFVTGFLRRFPHENGDSFVICHEVSRIPGSFFFFPHTPWWSVFCGALIFPDRPRFWMWSILLQCVSLATEGFLFRPCLRLAKENLQFEREHANISPVFQLSVFGINLELLGWISPEDES